MGDTTTVERLLEELARGCAPPPEEETPAAYRPVAVYDRTGWPWPGVITGWWTDPDGLTLCRLRLSGLPEARWAVFDAERIILLVAGGT